MSVRISRSVVITYERDGHRYRASGFHLRDDLVLTAGHIGGAAWREGNHQLQGVVGKGLGPGLAQGEQGGGQGLGELTLGEVHGVAAKRRA